MRPTCNFSLNYTIFHTQARLFQWLFSLIKLLLKSGLLCFHTFTGNIYCRWVITVFESEAHSDLIPSNVCVSHVCMSCQQQRAIATSLHIEPKAVQRLELCNLGLIATDGCSEVPFPEVLRGRDRRQWGEAAGSAHKRGLLWKIQRSTIFPSLYYLCRASGITATTTGQTVQSHLTSVYHLIWKSPVTLNYLAGLLSDIFLHFG